MQELWISFIGWFLLSAAQMNIQHLAFTQALAGLRAQDIMTAQTVGVRAPLFLARGW